MEKKKPGRPKKKLLVEPIDIQGIVTKPVKTNDCIELVYSNPSLFKKLFQMYKSFEVSEIEIVFYPDKMLLYTTDHLGKSNIYVNIEGKHMNLYYCGKTTHIIIKRENLERILGTLGKTNYKISIQIHEDNKTTMYITINDYEYNSEDIYDIDVILVQNDNAIPTMTDETYPLQFKFNSKHFKNKINNIRKSSPVFTIQKYGDDPLQITYDKSQKGTNWTGVYNDKEKMELKCDITPDDVFNVSVVIDYIRPFSNSNIGDDVYIKVDKHDKISFMTPLDKKGDDYAAYVKIFTEIKDYRNTPL